MSERRFLPPAPLAEAEEKLRKIAKKMDTEMPDGWGFTLIFSAFKDPSGATTYISSCQRQCAISILRSLADRFENELKKE